MSNILVKGGNPLKGTVRISGAKNSVLPILAATLLSDGKITIHDVPHLADVNAVIDTISALGKDITLEDHVVNIKEGGNITSFPPDEHVVKLRASFLMAGSILAKTGRVRIALPGGCAIGSRPIDLHLKGFRTMGAVVTMEENHIDITCQQLKGGRIYLDFPSVGATENIMIAATLAEGVTVIENAAKEPEIIDLAEFLNKLGADVRDAGSDVITIYGKEAFTEDMNHTIIPDRIEAGTYMVAAAITGGEVLVENVILNHLQPVVAKLRELGVVLEDRRGSVLVKGVKTMQPANVQTMPYPGFPTDLQAQMMIILCTIPGQSTVTETIFENRLMHAEEFIKMGANITLEGKNTAHVHGVEKLKGTLVRATDLRTGASLILGGLVAEGETEIADAYHIYRGYEDFIEKFKALGAEISSQ